MREIDCIMALVAMLVAIHNLVDAYKINKWIEKNDMDNESKIDPSI